MSIPPTNGEGGLLERHRLKTIFSPPVRIHPALIAALDLCTCLAAVLIEKFVIRSMLVQTTFPAVYLMPGKIIQTNLAIIDSLTI